MKRCFSRSSRQEPPSIPNPYWRRYDVEFCDGASALQNALAKINEAGYVIVSVTQYEFNYTVVFKRFD